MELLGRVKTTVQGALAHADVPFQQIVSDLNVPRNAAYSPVFQTMFALEDNTSDPQDAAADKAERIEVRISIISIEHSHTKYSQDLCARLAIVACCLSHVQTCRQDYSRLISVSLMITGREHQHAIRSDAHSVGGLIAHRQPDLHH